MESPLLVAAASGNAQIVHQLLQIQSIDANQRAQALGALPLHVAANSGCVSVRRIPALGVLPLFSHYLYCSE